MSFFTEASTESITGPSRDSAVCDSLFCSAADTLPPALFPFLALPSSSPPKTGFFRLDTASGFAFIDELPRPLFPGALTTDCFAGTFFPTVFVFSIFISAAFLTLVFFAADRFTLGLVVVFAAIFALTATCFSVVAFGLILVAIRRQSPS